MGSFAEKVAKALWQACEPGTHEIDPAARCCRLCRMEERDIAKEWRESPRLLAAWQVSLLQKYNEAIALQYVMPFSPI